MIFWLAEHQSANDSAFSESLLTSEEALVFARLSGDLRRAEWLLGRSLAKQLVQRYCDVSQLDVPDRREIGVLPGANGAPVVHIGGTPQTLAISISHSLGAAFCALTPEPGLRIGADIERIAPRDETFLLDFFTPAERTQVEILPEAKRPILATAIWSAREAFYKALGAGLPLRQGVLEIEVSELPAEEWSPFVLRNTDEGAWEGSWRLWGSHVMAVVTG
jgi:phosphopantetheine--protein transferase-like protein